MELLLVEIELVAADRGGRTQITSGQFFRMRPDCHRGRSDIDGQALERGKSVRRSNRINDLGTERVGREPIEPRTADGKAMMGESHDARIGNGRRRVVEQRSLVLAPQGAKRFAIDALEHAGRGVRDASRRRIGQLRERVGAEAIGQVLMEAQAVGVRRVTFGPVGQASVDPVDRLEHVLACCFTQNCAKIAGVQPPLAGERAFFIRREAFDLPDRQIQVRKTDRHAAEEPPDRSRPALRSIEVNDVRELVCEDQAQPIVDLANELVSCRPGGRHDDGVVRHRRRGAVGQFRLIDEHDVGPRRRLHAERSP